MHEPLLLADLPVGARAEIVSVEASPGAAGPDGVAARLADLGFLPGTAVQVLRRAPLGDPRVYELRSTRICLRRREARRVRVRVRPA